MHLPPHRAQPCSAATLLAAAIAPLLASCSILQPVPPLAVDRGVMRWSPGQPAKPAAQGGPGQAAVPPTCSDDTRFAGGLGAAMCEVDQQRLDLVSRAAETINQTASYNALLWPIGAGVMYEMLRGATNQNLLLPAALAAGAYGFMSAGVPERQQIYLATARKLGCALVGASVNLYPVKDIKAPWDDAPTFDIAPLLALNTSIRDLRQETKRYEAARANLLPQLKPRLGAAGRPAGSTQEAIVRKHAGTGDGSSRGKDSRDPLAAQTASRLTAASRLLADGVSLARRIAGAGLLLRAERSRIEGEMINLIAAKAPPPADPASVASALVATSKQLLKLQAGESQRALSAAGSSADPLDPALPAEVYDGLSDVSMTKLADFQKDYAAPLRQAQRQLASWLDEHEARRVDVNQALQQAGCTVLESSPLAAAAPATPAPPAPPANTPRPTTSLTNGSPPSGTRLP